MVTMNDMLLPMSIPTEEGSLSVNASPSGGLCIFYRPSDGRVEQQGWGARRDHLEPVKLVEFHPAEGCLTVFPTDMTSSGDFLRSKYSQILRITVRMHFDNVFPLGEDDILSLLEGLPSCLAKDYDHGLGFKQAYRDIITAIEDLSDCDHLVVARDTETDIDFQDRAFHVSWTDLEVLRKEIDKVNRHSRNAANSVNAATARNFIARAIGEPEVPVKFGRSPLRRGFTNWALTGEHYLPEEDQELFLDVLGANAPKLAEKQPKRVALVQQELELASLTEVIDIYEALLRTPCTEEDWQQFFSDNPFALHLSFGYPVIKVREKAAIGGRDFSGKGGSITDFLVKNKMTHNAALIEIKTPQAQLVSQKPYRKGIYVPHPDLVGAVNQVLDQKVKFERSLTMSRAHEEDIELEAYGVGCVVIAGCSSVDKEKIKSFELFRQNSKNVDIVTFDELLAKLTELKEFLGVRAEGG